MWVNIPVPWMELGNALEANFPLCFFEGQTFRKKPTRISWDDFEQYVSHESALIYLVTWSDYDDPYGDVAWRVRCVPKRKYELVCFISCEFSWVFGMLTCPIALFFFMGLFSLFTDTLRTWKGIRGQNGLSLSICQVHCQHIGMYTMIDTAVRIMGSQNRPFGDHRTLLYRVKPLHQCFNFGVSKNSDSTFKYSNVLHCSFKHIILTHMYIIDIYSQLIHECCNDVCLSFITGWFSSTRYPHLFATSWYLPTRSVRTIITSSSCISLGGWVLCIKRLT